jgi:4-hydroxy-tetrahydrodipicolinate synthase
MIDPAAHGVYVIAPTPFDEDGRVDEASTDRMTDFYLEAGCTGITILGVMGEAPKLEGDEARSFSARVVRRAKGKPVIVGVSAPGFAAMRTLARSVMEDGAAGVMIAPPFNLRTDDQIVSYFQSAAEAIGTDVPICIQDHPQSTTVIMSPSVIRRIITTVSSAAMLKHEQWPGLEKLSAIRAFERDGMRRVPILVGNGGLFLDFEMERGADGAMTGYAFPDMLVDVIRLSRAGNREAAHDLFDAHLPMIRYEHQQDVGLAVRKHVLKRRGIIANDTQRKPRITMSESTRAEVAYLLSRLARADRRAAALAA